MKAAIGLLFLAGWSGPVLACDCIRLDPKGSRFESDLDRIAEYYPVAAEGVLEKEGPYAWRFSPTREYRGRGKRSYPITLISDCTLGPQELAALVGKPVFVLLVEGPGDHQGNYEISRCVNLLGADIENALRARFMGACTPR
ncbi:MAG TPA: hypothetical protein VMN38_05095 [Sphingomicrobium sp.]|nr:hypothetical protein [Sphingomicrobium sp.]